MSTAYEVQTLKRSQEGRYTISTIEDNGICETAIYKHRDRIVVAQRYPSKTAAIEGHGAWLTYCKGKPVSAYDVNYRRRMRL